MTPVLQIARLTIIEARRKRTFLAAALLSLLALAAVFTLTLIAEHVTDGDGQRQHARIVDPDDPDASAEGSSDVRGHRPLGRNMAIQALRAGGMWIVRTFPTIVAILLAAGAVAPERESGALHTIVSKPISRWSIVVGKWLGLNAVLFAHVLVLGLVLTILLTIRAGYVPWPVLGASIVSLLFPAIFTSLGVLFSTFTSVWLAVGMGLFAWGIGAQEYGVLRIISVGLREMKATAAGAVVEGACRLAGLLVPVGRVGGWVDRAGGEVLFMVPGELARPEATPWSLLYLVAHVSATLALAAWVFQRKDV